MTAVPAIGIDLGATRIKGALVVDGAVDPAHEAIVSVEHDRSQGAVVATLARLVAQLDPGGAAPVGIAAAGVIDQRAGILRESPNFPQWRDFALGAELAAATGRRVVLDNDANAVILGEARYGVARGYDCVVGYTLGTGVGGGIVLHGRTWSGERGMAGELGHVTVEPEGRACGCGNRGCLEQYAGQVGLIQTLRELGPPLAHLLLPDASDGPRRLAALADAGDAAARAVFADIGRRLGFAAASVLHTLDVTTFVLSGGIAGAFDHLVAPMRAELVARTFRSMSEGVRILQGSLGPRAGVLGAAASAVAAATAGP